MHELGVPSGRITDMLKRWALDHRRPGALRLRRYVNPQFWLELQSQCEPAVTEGGRGAEIARRLQPADA